MGVLDVLGAASGAHRTETLIMDEALDAEWRALQARLNDAADDDLKQAMSGASLANPQPLTTEIVERMEEIRAQVEASQVDFEFAKLDWRVRVRIQSEHPPRDGNRLDAMRGYNIETYTPAVIRETCVKVTSADGDVKTKDEIPATLWDQLLGTDDAAALLGFEQVNRLFVAATTVNDVAPSLPPSARFLLGSQDSGASLAQPDPGTSAPSASKAGSRRGSRKSSATPTGESAA